MREGVAPPARGAARPGAPASGVHAVGLHAVGLEGTASVSLRSLWAVGCRQAALWRVLGGNVPPLPRVQAGPLTLRSCSARSAPGLGMRVFPPGMFPRAEGCLLPPGCPSPVPGLRCQGEPSPAPLCSEQGASAAPSSAGAPEATSRHSGTTFCRGVAAFAS